MKKALLTTFLLAVCFFGYAQDRGKTYLNINYSSAKLSQPSTDKLSNCSLTILVDYFQPYLQYGLTQVKCSIFNVQCSILYTPPPLRY